MPIRYIETGRLILTPLTAEDAPDVFEWTGDPEVNRYMPYPLHKDISETVSWISGLGDKYEFGFRLKDGEKLIGAGSVVRRDGFSGLELGYNLNRRYWGQGYATEAARGLIYWARDSLGEYEFFARHAVENTASGRVLEKCGFTYTHDGEYSRIDGSETFRARCYYLDFGLPF